VGQLYVSVGGRAQGEQEKMNVIDHAHNQWTLLKDGDDYLMYVVTGVSFQSFYYVVKLNAEQVSTMSQGGREACESLAVELADHWIEYCDPDFPYEEAASQAVSKWEKAHGQTDNC
jgi:hypothetical protein